MNARNIAIGLFNQHLALAATDGTLFRRTVMDALKATTGCSQAAAATHYNTAKKLAAPINGLGRVPVAKGVRKISNITTKVVEPDVPDNECFTVIELLDNGTVGRCYPYILQGDASECFDIKFETWKQSTWIMIQGLGPNHGEVFKLAEDELEIKRHVSV